MRDNKAPRKKKCPRTSPNSASNAIPNCKVPETPLYSLVQRASGATRYVQYVLAKEQERGGKND